ncbi:hypothetical protein [Aneurinibacillus tyrosinisolvens]|uniref:hypothetical protein n=1 Tax=Aneurinibacillus tyrosinisolvens TaxID=1443435 RepID=UPI00063F2883|nr:hypothetical protein [Aneurinibacillus tyrosinisolvens]
MDTKFFCAHCGLYAYYCECLPEIHPPHHSELLHRLYHEAETIISEEDVPIVLRQLSKGEGKLILHPIRNGFYSAKVVTTSPSY